MVAIPPHLVAWIDERIARLAAARDGRTAFHSPLASRFGVLPLYADMGGVLALKPTGEVLVFSNDVDWSRRGMVPPEADPAWTTVALVAGSERYLELKALLPRRPAGAKTCATCRGRGRALVLGSKEGPLCGKCCGLGWEGLSLAK